MKISFLSQHYGRDNRGAETYVQELSNELKKLGHEVNVYSNIFSKVDPKSEIVISTNGRWDVYAAKVWCKVHKAKLIISGQSGLGIDDRLNLWTFPEVFVAMTDYQVKWAKTVNPFVKIIKIPNGVDLAKFTPTIKPLALNLKKPIILNVGAVTSFKRQGLLLSAAKQIGASVLLVGKGGDLNLPHSKMPNVYTACDLFAYPTTPAESFGISILEAMASGLAVVATDDPIRREIIGNAGLVVDPGDIKAFADSLQKALKENWGEKPRRQAEKFSWDKIAIQYQDLFNSL